MKLFFDSEKKDFSLRKTISHVILFNSISTLHVTYSAKINLEVGFKGGLKLRLPTLQKMTKHQYFENDLL